MRSCIYEGRVRHHRLRPRRHEFSYSIYLMYLDLSELETVFRGRWLWSTHRPAFARFRRADHLGDPSVPLERAVRDLVEEKTGERSDGPIGLLTHLRYFGYVVNPVSFYYCFDTKGEQVQAIVAEVTNTPWGERHCYVLQPQPTPDTSSYVAAMDKEFHVSPFMGMEQHYHWRLSRPGDRLIVGITSFEAQTRVFEAVLALRKKPVTTWQLGRVLLSYPLITAKVIAGIYWQACRLWWKGVPYHPHPQRPMKQKASA